MDYNAEYARWLGSEELDAAFRRELEAIGDNEAEKEERFYTELEFGTAGLRGILGAGTNRMNEYVVRRASAGLSKYLLGIEGSARRGVAVAYDSRLRSEEFARETACTLAAYGIKTYLFKALHSVPQLSFTVRELKCIAGVVITASHNPSKYNGYKVYWEHGGQVGPAQADSILECIRSVDYFGLPRVDYYEALNSGMIELIGEDIDELYYKKTLSLLQNPEYDRKHGGEIAVVYTPLHGSGCVPVKAVLERMGITRLYTVKEQEEPDGTFPTVSAPNPEDPNAFELALKLAGEKDALLILGTDPDSDRLGVALRDKRGGFHALTGNQIGSLLIYYLLSIRKQNGTLPNNGLVVKSIVSTSLADAICARFGVDIKHVLTGFRFIAEQIDTAEETGEHEFIFGFEESYGFLAGGFAHDKDAICAAMLVTEAALHYARSGRSLIDVLNDIYREFGFYSERVKSYTLEGREGMERIRAAMKGLREDQPAAIGCETVLIYEDFSINLHRDCVKGSESAIGLPKSNVLRYFFADDGWMVVRPSGTEPKLKLYIGVRSDDEAGVNSRLDGLMNAADALIKGLLGV